MPGQRTPILPDYMWLSCLREAYWSGLDLGESDKHPTRGLTEDRAYVGQEAVRDPGDLPLRHSPHHIQNLSSAWCEMAAYVLAIESAFQPAGRREG